MDLDAPLHRQPLGDLATAEPGLPPTARMQGELKPLGTEPLDARVIRDTARELLGDKEWRFFSKRLSHDSSCIIAGVRCRIHAMKTQRGIGLAIRLLSSFQPTLERLNLHPDLGKLVQKRHGLIVVCGHTGAGKSSTLAALIHEILELIDDVVDELGTREEVEYVHTILNEGSSADRQLRVYRETGDLKAVVDALVEETSQGC